VLSDVKVFHFGAGVDNTPFPYVSQGHWQDAAGNTADAASPISGYELYPKGLLYPHWTPEWLASYREDIPYAYVHVGTLAPGQSFTGTSAFSVNLVSWPSVKNLGLDGFANAAQVPEPSTLALFASGALVLGCAALARRRRGKSL